MWCKNCNIETNEKICPICGEESIEDLPVEIYWCSHCKTPIIQTVNQADIGKCPLCGRKTKYMCSDLRPVFPQERLLLEALLGVAPHEYKEKSVWAADSRYYIDGKSISIPSKTFQHADAEAITKIIHAEEPNNTYDYFESHIANFIAANQNRLDYLIDEAHHFVKKAAERFDEEHIVVSFSGGKDSTVTADVVTKALSNPELTHIFGNTTLEFPYTLEYAQRFNDAHEQCFWIAKNNEQDFYDVCEDIGPPARMMRWCCSMFKTGPITRIINKLYRDARILTFYGIRKSESVSRSKYNRIEDDAESVKIQQQTVASPIFFWKDIDIWLYILAEKIDFNDAYRLGYDRVGCWCCPNNNQRAQFLSRIYMPEQSRKWRDFLISFAEKIGKPDPEVYVDTGKWKARQGGNGLASAGDVKIKFTNCTTEEHAKIYRLVRPFDDELVGMFTPFGRVAPELGQKLLNEVLVLDVRTNVPILSIQPFGQQGYDYAVKIRTMNVADHENLQRMVGYQIRKFNACRKCLKCESLCRAGAISIVGDSYYINPDKCVRCKMCVTPKYLDGGCIPPKSVGTLVRDMLETIDANEDKSKQFVATFEEIYRDIQANKARINALEREEKEKLAEIAKIGNVDTTSAEQNLYSYKQKISELREELEKKLSEEGSKKSEIETADNNFNMLKSKSDKAKKFNLYYRYAEALYNWVNENYSKKEDEMRSRLSEYIAELFNNMYTGQREIIIDEQYNITARSKEGNTALTGGLRVIAYFAFVGGLVKLAYEVMQEREKDEDAQALGERYPLVLDAAFSHADETHTKNIARELANAAHQLVFAVMPKDWQYAKEGLSGKVGRIYELQKIDESEARILEVK